MRRAEAEEVEEAKKVEDDGSRKMHHGPMALRAEGIFYLMLDPQEFECFTSG